MKIKNALLIALFLGTFSLIGCRETTTEKTVIREVEVEKPVAEDTPGILERAAKEVDKEVNEEIDEEIKKIGNDDN